MYNYLVAPTYTLSVSPSPGVVPLVQRLDFWASKCIFLSYQVPGTQTYLKGRDDFYLVAFWVFVFTLLRECMIRFVWVPFGRSQGIKKSSIALRFGEQGWQVAYYSVSWIIGLVSYLL